MSRRKYSKRRYRKKYRRSKGRRLQKAIKRVMKRTTEKKLV